MNKTLTNILLMLVALQFVISAPHAMAARASVTLNGRPLLPAQGSAAGVWFYTGSGRPAETQVLLTGHTAVSNGWRLTAALAAGDTVRILVDSAAPLTNILFQSVALSGNALTCQSENNAIIIHASARAGAVRLVGLVSEGSP